MAGVIRAYAAADVAAVCAINNAAYPAMNRLDAAAVEAIVAECVHARVVEDDDGVAAFLFALPPGAQYASDNYAWFSARYASFVYVDRIAVHPRAQSRGCGSRLYEDLAVAAQGRWPCILAEVNLMPPNPGSARFHARHGFTAVGELEHPFDGAYAKRTVMLHRALAQGPT